MTDNFYIEKLAFTLLMLVVAITIYLLCKKLSSLSKYSAEAKFYLSFLYSSIFVLLIFYPILIVDDIYGIGNQYLTAMALLFIPVNLIALPVFLFAFLLSHYQTRKK